MRRPAPKILTVFNLLLLLPPLPPSLLPPRPAGGAGFCSRAERDLMREARSTARSEGSRRVVRRSQTEQAWGRRLILLNAFALHCRETLLGYVLHLHLLHLF